MDRAVSHFLTLSHPTHPPTSPNTQAWLQHIRLYPALKDAPIFRSFLLDHVNLPPPYLELIYGGGKGGSVGSEGSGGGGEGEGGGGGGGGGGEEEEEGEDMDMDDLFQG